MIYPSYRLCENISKTKSKKKTPNIPFSTADLTTGSESGSNWFKPVVVEALPASGSIVVFVSDGKTS